MTRSLSVVVCLLSIAIASTPAYAGSHKRVSLTCNSFAPNVITGDATLYLCEDMACTTTQQCDPLNCDSSGATAPAKVTIACVAPFDPVAAEADESYVDDANGPLAAVTQSFTVTGPLVKGKVQFVSTQVSMNKDGDTVILEVK